MATPTAQSEAKPWLRQPNVLWRRINDRIEQRMAVVEVGVVSLLERPLRPDELSACEREAELLAEWLFALGLATSGRLAREIGDSFRKGDLQNRDASVLAARLDDLRRVLRGAADGWTGVVPSGTQIHVVSPIDAHVDAAMWHLQQQGAVVTHSPAFLNAPDNADAFAIYAPENIGDTGPLLEAVGRHSATTRRILIHTADEAKKTLSTLANKSDVVLSHALSPQELASEIHGASLPDPVWLNNVVLYGANDIYKYILPYDFQASIATKIDEVLQTLDDNWRTVIIGSEANEPPAAVALLRATPKTRDTLIVVAGVDSTTATQCRQLGADLVVETTADPDNWVLHLRGLRNRRRSLAVAEQEWAAVVPPWPQAVVSFDRALAGLGRSNGIASLAIVSMPATISELDRQGVEETLTTEFRKDDLLGRTDDGRLVVLLKGASRRAAAERMHLAVQHLGLPESSGRVGIAQFPVDGFGLNNLIDAASQASARARAKDGPVTVPSDWFAESDDLSDVLLVESDPTLATVLEQLLGQMSLTSTHVSTGSEARRLLTGPNAGPTPRLLLIELDAMGADGLMMLRSLARHGVLSRTQVMVTCARINDGELREAFELGAIDVIRKPFSAVVLSNRIQQALKRS